MKKLLNTLTVLMFFGFIVTTLYVFRLPPFTPKKEILKPSSPSTEQKNDSTSVPKVGRSKTYDEHLKKGTLLEQNKYSSLAIVEYQAAAKLEPQKFEPYLKIGRIHLRNNKFAEAEEVFRKALELSPQNIDLQIYLGRSLLGQRKIAEARELFNTLTAVHQSVKYYQGILAAFFGEYDQSKNLLNEAANLATSTDITAKAKNYLNAFNEFNFNQGGSDIHLKALLCRSFNQTGEYQMAIAMLFDIIKLKKDYRDAWILLGYAYLQTENYTDALEAFSEAKKLDAQKAETSFFLGLTYYGLNNLPQAVKSLEEAKKNGFQPVIQIDQKLAEIYVQLKEYEKAAASFEQVVSLNDEDIHYYVKPIWVYLEKLNQPAKALSLAERALARHPNEAMGVNLLGWAQIYNGEFTEAEKNLNAALAIDPAFDAAYLNLGLLHEKKNEPKQALAYYRKAHSMGKGNSISQSAAQRYGNLVAALQGNDTIKADILNSPPSP